MMPAKLFKAKSKYHLRPAGHRDTPTPQRPSGSLRGRWLPEPSISCRKAVARPLLAGIQPLAWGLRVQENLALGTNEDLRVRGGGGDCHRSGQGWTEACVSFPGTSNPGPARGTCPARGDRLKQARRPRAGGSPAPSEAVQGKFQALGQLPLPSVATPPGLGARGGGAADELTGQPVPWVTPAPPLSTHALQRSALRRAARTATLRTFIVSPRTPRSP